MKIAVTTPTGHVGSRVVQLLIQAGIRPVVLLRDPEKLPAGVRDHVEAKQGDQGDGDFVLRATEGVEALFWLAPHDNHDEDPIGTTARMAEHAARAVRENGIERVVFNSSVGAEKRHGAGLIDGLARTEEALNATGTNVMILRNGYFFVNLLIEVEDLKKGILKTATDPKAAMPWVDPRDIGDVAAARLLSTAWSGHQIQAVHGPEDLSYERVAEIVSEATGREIRLQKISDEEEKARMVAVGISEGSANAYLGMTTGLREGFVPEQPRTEFTTTPTTLGAWAYANLRPALAL